MIAKFQIVPCPLTKLFARCNFSTIHNVVTIIIIPKKSMAYVKFLLDAITVIQF